MSRTPPSIATTSTLAMLRAAAARGVETEDILRQAGVERDVVESPDARLPGPTVIGIWNALRERTGDPALQLDAPGCLPFGAYRVVDYLVGASATVGDGVQRFARFFRLIADGVAMHVQDEAGEYRLCLATTDGGAIPPVYVDYVFAALVVRVRMRIRPQLEVLRVDFRQPEPAGSARYGEVFGAPIRFDAPADRLCFSAAEWRAPMESADAALARLLEEHARILAQSLGPSSPGFIAEVEQAIAAAPPERGAAEDIARALHVSVRTLQRRLVAAGTTFREVSDRVRGQLAREYLADPQVSIAEIAFLLGFSDQSSLNRAFRRWTGESPGRWRRRREHTTPPA